MPSVPAGLVHQGQLASRIAKAIRKLGKEVVRANYSIAEDSTGELAIYFRILLTDAASKQARLAQVAPRIEKILDEEIRPQENFGLLSYFTFRSKAEQDQLKDPAWN